MASWHEASCLRPDVELVDGNNPFCMSCGAIVSSDDTEPDRTPPPPIPFVEQFELNLKWPSSVEYSTTPPGWDGESIEAVMAAVQESVRTSNAVIERSFTPDSDQTMNDTTDLDVQEPAAGSSNFLDGLPGTDSIRLLRLSKGIASEPLHGVLEVHQLKYFPDFEALSYTWATADGDSTRNKRLYLGRDWSPFPITTNCDAALRCLRLPTSDRVVWVDAICINQTSTHERSHQVQLMPIIYAAAKRVLIYLGQDEAKADIKDERLSVSDSELDWDDEWNSIDSRLKRPYFFRSWVIQEIAAAKTAIVSAGFSWYSWPIHDRSRTGKHRMFLPWINHFDTRKYKDPSDLIQLVVDSWSSQAGDPRDKVFALLGVIAGAASDGLLADYSLSTSQVYTGFASYAITMYGALDLLQYAGSYTKSPGLPSWVPDWAALSTNWNIMHQLEVFRSETAVIDLLCSCSFAMMQIEQLEITWLLDHQHPVQATPATVHKTTGALITSVFKIDELSNGYSKMDPDPKYPFCSVYNGPMIIITPREASETDTVCCLGGSDMTVLLRRQGQKNVYTFIGICHVWVQTGLTRFTSESHPRQNYNPAADSFAHLPRMILEHVQRGFLRNSEPNVQLSRGLSWVYPITGNSADEIKISDMSEDKVRTLEARGREVERQWIDTIRHQYPAYLLAGSKGEQDMMTPVVSLLSDIRAELERQRGHWLRMEKFVRLRLRATRESLQLAEKEELSQVSKDIRSWTMFLNRHRDNFKENSIEGSHPKPRYVATGLGTLGDMAARRPSGPVWRAGVRSSSSSSNKVLKPLGSVTMEEELSCPIFFSLMSTASQWFRLQAYQAQDALLVYEGTATDLTSKELPQPTGVEDTELNQRSNSQIVTSWLEGWDVAIRDVSTMKKCLAQFIEQRAQYNAFAQVKAEQIAII